MKTTSQTLSARERQIMDALYRLKGGTVAEVRAGLPDPPSYSAVRAMLRILEEKGHLAHRQEGRRYVYLPRVPRSRAQRSALRRVLQTFFAGSPTAAIAALLDLEATELEPQELDRLEELIAEARRKGS